MRKEKTIAMLDDDKELRFHLRQMSAFDFENWSLRLAHMLRGGGLDIPAGQEVQDASKAVFDANFHPPMSALMGGGADAALGLVNEIFLCCAYIDERGRHITLTPDVLEGLIDQAPTLLGLRKEVLLLNLDWAVIKPEDAPALAPLDLPEKARYQQACARCKSSGYLSFSVCGALALAGLATWDELKNVYSYRDALEMDRLLEIGNYNTWVNAENAQAGRR